MVTLLIPKPGWTNINLAGIISSALDIPVAIDTDVNGAVLGEQEWGAAQGLKTFIYVTLGTGIGGGGIMRHPNLLEAIQRKVEKLLNQYLPALDTLEKISNYLVHPALEDAKTNISSGVLGAIVLAKRRHLVND